MNSNKGLYIHIPFCKSKCPYCDFYSVKFDEETVNAYCDALIDEIKNGSRLSKFVSRSDMNFDTVYFGGGTPSMIGADRIGKILEAARKYYNITSDAEITVECNPSSSEDGFFRIASEYGVNRISLGMQSADDSERKALGRLADRKTVYDCVNSAEKYGISNISLDLMTGIPKQTMKSLDETIDFCLSLEVPHISAYMLTIEENTPFYKLQNKLNLPSEDEVCDMYLHLSNRLKEYGIMHYEISNYAKKGFESRHNLKYWNCEEYIGLGPAAHSFVNGKRFFQPRSVKSYIDGEKAVFDCTGGDENEYIMLKLRLKSGLNYSDFEERFSEKVPQKVIANAENLRKNGLTDIFSDRICLTDKGFLLSNSAICKIIDY